MAAVILPAGLLSAVAPIVAKLQLRDLHQTGTIVGKLSGIGTLGGIVATFATGFVLVAAFRTSTILIGTGAVVAAVGALMLGYDRQRHGRWGGGGPLPGAAVALLPVSLLLVAVAPDPCQQETEYHCARVVADPERPAGRTLELDTLRHSYVDLADPEYLEFDYTKAIASVADAISAGGGADPGPAHRRRRLHDAALPRREPARHPQHGAGDRRRRGAARPAAAGRGPHPAPVRTGRGRPDRAAGAAAGPRDLVVGDAFGGLAVPWHLTTREVAEQVRDALTGTGVYAVNVIDYQPDRFARAEAATLRSVFGHVVLLGAPVTVAGEGGGNHILVASRQPLPLADIQRRLAERGPWLVADEAATARFAGTAEVLTDAHAPVDQLITQFTRSS